LAPDFPFSFDVNAFAVTVTRTCVICVLPVGVDADKKLCQLLFRVENTLNFGVTDESNRQPGSWKDVAEERDRLLAHSPSPQSKRFRMKSRLGLKISADVGTPLRAN
jgi:hypothetical protein